MLKGQMNNKLLFWEAEYSRVKGSKYYKKYTFMLNKMSWKLRYYPWLKSYKNAIFWVSFQGWKISTQFFVYSSNKTQWLNSFFWVDAGFGSRTDTEVLWCCVESRMDNKLRCCCALHVEVWLIRLEHDSRTFSHKYLLLHLLWASGFYS